MSLHNLRYWKHVSHLGFRDIVRVTFTDVEQVFVLLSTDLYCRNCLLCRSA